MMNYTTKLLTIISLMIFQALASANNINEHTVKSSEKWSFSKELKAQFVKKENANYLVVSNKNNEVIAKKLIPRAKNLSNITWSSSDQYLTYTDNDRSLWLFNIEESSVTLIEHNLLSQTPLKFNAQWSPNGQWMQYISKNNSRYPAKVYSLQRKRSYFVPIASNLISDIAWHRDNNELVINVEQPIQSQPKMSLLDIKMTVKSGTQVVQLY
ncbi:MULTISPECIES: hypothetical protein [Thalassotalea]|uniref:Dipeptidylpeptidase IV N-terminal domain-containing protein n=1 Tax=Thalassotalea castellviae TaxID=3075612 RepID=A0ABU3A3G4_9GAMM|nr:hypothetical protein [Thalassotalea sp. W431]MDT0604355.1 hypothetical protein [Thalassotalea sp. W431]